MSWKLCKKSSFEMEFKGLVTFRWMSEISSNIFPFKASLSRGNRKKFGGLRSGENDGCSICTTPLFARNCLTILACEGEHCREKKPRTLLHLLMSHPAKTFPETGQNFNVPCSIH
ncbi:hypothetical protein TNCV_884001 [Trichonephila clavipes]|nr:hypothetical protein TNCV_884001 [Trichonephila clavipes]